MRKEKLLGLAIITLLQVSTIALAHAQEEPVPIPGDPGNTPQTSVRVYSNITYLQSLSYATGDTDDCYNFTAYNSHWINVTMTPPSSSYYAMLLLDPSYNTKNSTIPSNTTQEMKFNATADGVWYLHVYLYSGPGGNYTFRIEPLNFPPITPNAPTGPASGIGYVYNDTTFSAVTSDVENDKINYTFDWNDGTTTANNSRPSGQAAIVKHQWVKPSDNSKPSYNVKAKAVDEHGNWTGTWSAATSIVIKQNDDNKGDDAGNLQANASFIPRVRFDDELLTSKGTLYNNTDPMDLNDWYKFPIQVNDIVSVTTTPPPAADFDLELWDPYGNSWTSKNQTPGYKEAIIRTATVAGNWTLRVNVPNSPTSGWGQYTFTLSLQLRTLTVKTRRTTGSEITSVKVWIDNVQYYSPVNHQETIGMHTVKADPIFMRGPFLYEFWYWENGSTANPRTIYFDGTADLTITAYYYVEYLGTCPTLFVWNGSDYVEEGLLNIHAESDITVQHKIGQPLCPENFIYNLELRELDEFTSHIDQVKLYAVDNQGKWHVCPLIYARHGNSYVTRILFFDDDKRIDLFPTETVSLKFLQSIQYKNTAFFVFEINGYNRKIE